MTPEPTVSVCMITYNHEDYIAEAIEGVLMQKTTFTFQLLIGEDRSTDNTWDICQEYASKYPKIIRLLERPKSNIGMMANFVRTMDACDGDYIALCEGDDYWTDPRKLNKQVKVLEENPETIVCHHWQTIAVKTESGYKEALAPTKGHGYLNQTISTVEEIFKNRLRVKTRTMLFRNIINNDFFPDWYFKMAYGDVPLNFLLGQYGNFYFIDEPMAVYRITESGVSTMGLKEKGWRKFKEFEFKNWIKIWDFSNKHYNYKFNSDCIRTTNFFLERILSSSINPYLKIFNLFIYNLTGRNSGLLQIIPNNFYLLQQLVKLLKNKFLRDIKR